MSFEKLEALGQKERKRQELFKRRTDSSIVISQLTNVLKDKTKGG